MFFHFFQFVAGLFSGGGVIYIYIYNSNRVFEMDPDDSLCDKGWIKSSSSSSSSSENDVLKNLALCNHQPFASFGMQQKFEETSYLGYQSRIEQEFSEFSHQKKKVNGREVDTPMQEANDSNKTADWDPKGMLNNLTFLEQKIHQLRDLVQLIVTRSGQSENESSELLVQQQQQLLTADLTCIIVQLISTAGSLLPHHLGQLGGGMQLSIVKKVEDQSHEINDLTCNGNGSGSGSGNGNGNGNGNSNNEHNFVVEEHETMKDEDDGEDGENLPPGSYEILQLEKEEILAPHTHFCTICGKGFKRDANLRMHMRGHGDEYKTAAALAKPHKELSSSEPALTKRYSCPYVGCKRNKDHKKFQPLKTILCVKNHYKRTHCDKSYTCSRCHAKKFSVIADLKTHEKHCGRDKWLCSCGTTFSRKDKLFGHIALFQGHTPAIPTDDTKGGSAVHSNEAVNNKVEKLDFKAQPSKVVVTNGTSSFQNMDDTASYFSPINYDPGNLNGSFQEFPRPPYEDSDSSFSFLLSGSTEYPPPPPPPPPKVVRYSGSSSLD